jgi:hypothetical protein
MDRSPSLAEIGVALPGVVGAAVRELSRERGACGRPEAGTGRAVDDLSGAEENGWTTRAVP